MRPRTLIAAFAALTTLSIAPAADAATATTYEHAAFRATNHQRVEHHRVKLRHTACLQRYADGQARRMARQERIFHQDLRAILRRCHLSMTGENVAMGYATGRQVVNRGWMHSAGHRANILQRRYRQMAIGARRGDDGSWYVSQVFGRHA